MLLIVILVVIILMSLWIQEGFIDSSTEVRAFPLHNPFKALFYTPIQHTYKVIANAQHHDLLRKIVGDAQYTTAPDNDVVNLINEGVYDFAVVPKLLAERAVRHENVRFVTGLHSATATFIGPNDSNLIDIGDFRHYSCPVSIGVMQGPDQACLSHILNAADAPAQIITYKSAEELANVYGSGYMIYFGLVDLRHMNDIIQKLTEKQPSHVLAMQKINRGAYHITYDETTFYQTHPYYQKDMIDTIRMRQQYPMLGSIGHTVLHIPSIKTRYILICNMNIPDKKIQELMAKVLRIIRTDKVFKGITIPDMNLGRSNLAFHPASHAIFNDLSAYHGSASSSTYSGSKST